ncbi:MAG: hypothetical protein KTR26_04155 [Flammeovirgaceae bacterium]|nr:hypothetical protein [Flammeovirgaceae bacterium]
MELNCTKIAHVSIKKSLTDYEILNLFQFLRIDLAKRTKMILQRQAEFIDFDGEMIPLGIAIKEITILITRLKEEGRIGEILRDKKREEVKEELEVS